jgi:acetyl-CoA synthetase
MIPETVVALLAIARIGAIAVPLFSGYGPAALETRLRDVGAKILFACDGFPRHGATVQSWSIAAEAADRYPQLSRLIVVSRTGSSPPMRPNRDLKWEDLLELGNRSAPEAGRTEATAAEDPCSFFTAPAQDSPRALSIPIAAFHLSARTWHWVRMSARVNASHGLQTLAG